MSQCTKLPFFSIVTPTKNAGHLLAITLQSINSQLFKNFEWIVIDSCSTDGSLNILDSPLEFKTTIVSEKDNGIADAWNKGIRLATSTNILILNAGDTYTENFLSELFTECNKYSNKIICAHANRVNTEYEIVAPFKASPERLPCGMFLPHNWAMVPKSFYTRHGLYKQIKFSMDYDFFYRVYSRDGLTAFHVIDKYMGNYLLGGYSDKHYVSSFVTNFKIQRLYGCNLIFPFAMLLYSVSKHFFVYILSLYKYFY